MRGQSHGHFEHPPDDEEGGIVQLENFGKVVGSGTKIEKRETQKSIERKIWRHKAIFEGTNRIEETARKSVANNRNLLFPS